MSSWKNLLLKLRRGSDGAVIDPATDTTLNAKLDIALSVLRDALRGASSNTLTDVVNAIKAQIEVSTSLWTDDSGTYYVRRDSVNEGTGAITVYFTDATGATVTPGAGLRPLSSAGKLLEQQLYDATGSGTGYSTNDILARVLIVDPSVSPPALTAVWMNVTQGTQISAPTGGTYVEQTKNVTETNSSAILTKLAGGLPAALLLGRLKASDQLTGFEALDDQTGDGTVKTFAFTNAPDLVWVRSVGAISRADPSGGTPTATKGVYCAADEPAPITFSGGTSLKVFAPVGAVVSVWGYRYT